MDFSLDEIPLPSSQPPPQGNVKSEASKVSSLDATSSFRSSKTIKNAFQIAKKSKFKLSLSLKPKETKAIVEVSAKPNEKCTDIPTALIKNVNATGNDKQAISQNNLKTFIPLPNDINNHHTVTSIKKVNASGNDLQAISQQKDLKTSVILPNDTNNHTVATIIDKENPDEEKTKIRLRKRKSRWTDAPKMDFSNFPANLINPLGISQLNPITLSNATSSYYDSMTPAQKIEFEETRKMQALCSYILAKNKMSHIFEQTGKVKYEYDSDEDTTEGTWEHKRRKAEMANTKELADLLTDMGRDKHHVGDFLPPEEFEQFMYTYHLLRESELTGNPDAFDETYGCGIENCAAAPQNHNSPPPSSPQNATSPPLPSHMTGKDELNEKESDHNTINLEENNGSTDIDDSSKKLPIQMVSSGELSTTEPQTPTTVSVAVEEEQTNIFSAIGAGLKNMTKEKLSELKKRNASDYQDAKLSFDNNIGYRILMKMGWDQEQGLGSQGQGIVDPVNKAIVLPHRLGLGTLSSRNDFNPALQMGDDDYQAYRKRMMLAYRFRPNPLNNPRRPYY